MENFEIYRDNFNSAEIGPFFGRLSTEFAFFTQSTLNLPTMAHYQGNHLRPVIRLLECDHPLFRHQQEGVTLAEAWEIVHRYVEPTSSA